MDNLNAIKKRIKSVNDISQMTSAMQLVSSAKMRRSIQLRQSMYPFFSKCAESMQEIRNSTPEINNPFYDLKQKTEGETWKIGYFVLSGEQGLAGAYNNNMVKIAEEHVHKKILENTKKNISTVYKFYVFGRPARDKLLRNGYNVDKEFSFPIAEPTFFQARNIASVIKQKFLNHEFDLVYLLYTNNVPGKGMVPVAIRLLPVDLKSVNYLTSVGSSDKVPAIDKGDEFEYFPNANAVFDYLIDTYMNAVLYGAMVEAYQSEQMARLTAMQNATDNADEMMKKLTLMSNRARQAKITTELTEIVNGAEQVDRI